MRLSKLYQSHPEVVVVFNAEGVILSRVQR